MNVSSFFDTFWPYVVNIYVLFQYHPTATKKMAEKKRERNKNIKTK